MMNTFSIYALLKRPRVLCFPHTDASMHRTGILVHCTIQLVQSMRYLKP
jgi:hypothetical protein